MFVIGMCLDQPEVVMHALRFDLCMYVNAV